MSNYGKNLTLPQRKYLMKQTEEEWQQLRYFYAMMKIHKDTLVIRSITACSGSILYRLRIFIDMYFQDMALTSDSYIKNSKSFKDRILQESEHRRAKKFTADARSMYINIDTQASIRGIGYFLFSNEHKFF